MQLDHLLNEAIPFKYELKNWQASKYYQLVRKRAAIRQQATRENICDFACMEEKDFLEQERLKGEIRGMAFDPLEVLVAELEDKIIQEGA